MTETPSRPLILAADDDPDILGLITRHLGRAGYDVVTAADGEEALQLVDRHSPALVVLDVSIPKLDGFAVCRAIQESSAWPPPVIFLTAHAQTGSRVTGLDSGAVDYMVKPFQSTELLARVRAALRTTAIRDRVRAEAARDNLTGVLTRAALDARAAELVALAARHERPLACAILDLDRFKEINDTYGHMTGDAVLRTVGPCLRSATRASDVVGRFGGDEFVVLLPETDLDGAHRLVEKLLHALEDARVEAPAGLRVEVRMSAGVACWGDQMETAEDLYAAADAALYEAKRLGRGRAVRATSPAVQGSR